VNANGVSKRYVAISLAEGAILLMRMPGSQEGR
jgi:hypothetical protein